MKSLLITLLISIISMNISALSISNVDQKAEDFNERYIERVGRTLENSSIQLLSDVPANIEELKSIELHELLSFAERLDLFSVGFSYDIDSRTYQITSNGEVLSYTFSINISKNGIVQTRRFYNLARRVDGVFYVDHIANY